MIIWLIPTFYKILQIYSLIQNITSILYNHWVVAKASDKYYVFSDPVISKEIISVYIFLLLLLTFFMEANKHFFKKVDDFETFKFRTFKNKKVKPSLGCYSGLKY